MGVCRMSNINEMSEFEKEEKLYTIEDFCASE